RADSTEQHCVRSQTSVQRCPWQWRARAPDARTTGRVFFEVKVVAVDVCDFTQHTHGLLGHFRSDSVTGKDYYFQLHIPLEAVQVLVNYAAADKVSLVANSEIKS